jgi:hypothetical protein
MHLYIDFIYKYTSVFYFYKEKYSKEKKIIWRTDQSNSIRKSFDGIHIKQFYSNKDTIHFIIDNKFVSIFLVIDKNFPSIDDDLFNENNKMSPLFTQTKRPIRIITDNIDDLILEDINKHTKYELCDDTGRAKNYGTMKNDVSNFWFLF